MPINFTGTEEELYAIAEDLLMCRKDFYHYYKRAVIDQRDGWVDGKHIHDVCNAVQDFLEQDEKHILCLSIAPRHSKSVMLSNALPAWLVSNNKNTEVMLISYALSLARDNLRACKSLMDSEFHRRVFPRIDYEVDSADALQLRGKLNGRPNIIPSGVNGPLSGKGATVAVIDDPTKGMTDALSETFQRRLIEWWNMVLVSRIEPKKGRIIIVATRWTDNDLISYVTRNNPDDCVVINFPAVLDTPEGRTPLWPERFSIRDLDIKRQQMGSLAWSAQYMGDPKTEGSLIKSDWLRTSPSLGKDAIRVRCWDLASTSDGDYTASCLMAYDPETGQFVVEDIQHFRGSPQEVQQTMLMTARADGYEVAIRKETEGGSSGIAYDDFIARHVLVGYDFRGIRPTGSKEVRAQPMAAAIENGTLTFVQKDWTRDLWDELVAFPFVAHDDRTDVVAYCFEELSKRFNDGGGFWVL